MNFSEIREKVNQINTALDQAVSQFILNVKNLMIFRLNVHTIL